MKTIAVDIDEVLAPIFENLVNWHNKQYGTNLELADNYSNDLKIWGAESIEEAIKRVQIFFSHPHFFDAQPVKEATHALKKLNKNYELVIITARDKIVEEVTLKWVAKYFPEIFRAVHFTAKYSLEGHNRSKSEVLIDIQANYLIDDSLENAIDAAKTGITVLLFGDYPWNQSATLPKNVVRVENWQKVLEYFDAKG